MPYHVIDREQATLAMPNGRRLIDGGYISSGFGIHRDSDVLHESNYAVIMRRLAEQAGIDVMSIGFVGVPDGIDVDRDPIAVASFNHWAVGWVHELMIRSDRPDLLAIADQALIAIDDYAILDEDDYSAREWDHNHPSDGECYSDDPECCTGE